MEKEKKKNNVTKKSSVKIQKEELCIEEEVYRDMQKIIDRNIAIIYHLISTPIPILLLNSEFSTYAKSDKAIIEHSDVEKAYRVMYEAKVYDELYKGKIGMFRYFLMIYFEMLTDSIEQEFFRWQTDIIIETNKTLLSVLHYIEEFSKDLEDISDEMVNDFFNSLATFLYNRFYRIGCYCADVQTATNCMFQTGNNTYYFFDGIDKTLWYEY